MIDRLTLNGKITFEVENKTKKHNNQASWKKMAMILIDGDITDYYAWFINKRYNLVLNKPLRGAHVSFINDSIKDMSLNGQRTNKEVDLLWEAVKKKWDKQIIPITIDLNPQSDLIHWWFNIPHDERGLLQGIRTELGLGKPYWGMHMSIGYANELNIEHSEYLNKTIKSDNINEISAERARLLLARELERKSKIKKR